MARNPLRSVCLIGLVLALIVSWSMVLFGVIWRRDAPEPHMAGNAFARELREFDLFDAPRRVLAGENPAPIERRLTRLRRRAQTAEEHLSALKRHRALALLDRRYLAYYERAAREAAEAFSFSPPLALVAAEAVILANPPGARALLGNYAGRVTQPRFEKLQLAINILAGNLDDPVHAAAVPGMETLLSHNFYGILPDTTRQNLLVNEFLLRAVRGDVHGATARLNSLLASPSPNDGIQRMAAEFFYDHNNPRRAAELFARLGGDTDMVRLADSLALAGEIPGARNIWFALSSPVALNGILPSAFPPVFPPGLQAQELARSRHFYNLAATSTDRQEETLWLERLFSYRAQTGQQRMDNTGIYSVIRYTRLMDVSRGIAILEENIMERHPLLDLELLRRNLEAWPPTRAAAEVWLLLNRHPGDEALHEWAAWYFEHQRLYAESGRLLNSVIREGMTGAWIDQHMALAFIRAGNISEGERLLREAGTGSADWRIFANLGRIYEDRRQISAALAAYETAAVLVGDRSAAAQMQMRVSRNLEALGRRQESREALERALELDPDNIHIRRELRRIGMRGNL